MSAIQSEICQICKKSVTFDNIFQIFDSTCTRFLEEIKEISGVNLKGIFNQPWYICMQCYTDLLTAQGFRKKCIESCEYQKTNQISEAVEEHKNLLSEFLRIAELPQAILNNKNTEKYSEEIFIGKAAVESSQKQKIIKISKICEICGNIFQTKRNFALHLRRHTNNKPFECELCSNKFHTNAELKCHMRRHTGEKPYECRHCHRKFSDYGTHKKHERTHTNERPFSCNFCEKAFTTTFILKNHILTHTGKRDFKCRVCDKSFVHVGHLTSHLKSIFHLKNCKRAEMEESEKQNK